MSIAYYELIKEIGSSGIILFYHISPKSTCNNNISQCHRLLIRL